MPRHHVAVRRSLVVAVCLARAAYADPDPKQGEAEALYTEGSKHYNLREYEPAIAAFKRAYALYPEPTFLFDIAQAYRLLNDCDNAAAFYSNYLRVKPDADDHEKAEQLAGEMERCAAEQKREREEERRRSRAAEALPRPAEDRTNLRIGGLVTAGAGLVLVGAGAYFSVDAADKSRQLEKLCMTSCNANDVAPIDSSGKSSSQIAVALYILGGVAVATGATMFVWHF
jgi:tetratricopeptide (TPR) repeat protein